MGTDIHAVAQAKIGDFWVDIESEFDEGRHYNLFAHLAGVRNGTGFAGVKTGTSVNPIQEGRGFPVDFEVDDEGYHRGSWMGDHSYGWVSVHEVLNHNWNQGMSCGVIKMEQYKNWGGGMPEGGWCGMAFGQNINVAESEDDISENSTHVRVWWDNDASEFDYFISEARRMADKYGNEVRIVFGFDS